MYPSKEDIQFFYEMGIYTTSDVMSFVEQGSITKEEAKEILTEQEEGENLWKESIKLLEKYQKLMA